MLNPHINRDKGKKQRMRWRGKGSRREGDKWITSVWKGNPVVRNPHGTHKKHWNYQIEEDQREKELETKQDKLS